MLCWIGRMERYADEKDWPMKNLIEEINCPVCEGMARLEEYDNDMYIDRIRRVVKFKMISYKCELCGEGFSTNESDDIVVSRINKGIRSEQRKIKIKKYVP